MPVEAISPEVSRLLTVALETVARLEILLAMRRDATRSFTGKSLSAMLAISTPVVDTHLAILCGRGFLGVTIGSDLVYCYEPISAKIEQQVTEIAHLWTTRRADVLQLLQPPDRDPARAFADAFWIRKPKPDG